MSLPYDHGITVDTELCASSLASARRPWRLARWRRVPGFSAPCRVIAVVGAAAATPGSGDAGVPGLDMAGFFFLVAALSGGGLGAVT